MDTSLSFFNWSLKKALDTEPDNFIKARIRIIYTILLFSLLKTVIVIGIASAHEQWMQATRAIVGFALYVIITKVLLYKPSALKTIAHIMLQMGLLLVWTNIFVFAHKINLLSVQFAFMIALCSFYTLGATFGVIYSVASVLPILLYLIFNGHLNIDFTGTAQEFASPGFEIMVVLNFLSLTMAHYLFYQAFHVNIKEKEQLNLQLQSSIAEANKLAESKSNFLSTMSHELRTPLNSVIGITELLLEDKPEERQKENLKILQFSALDLLSLINNVLDFNKIDSDKLVLEKIPFNLAEFMHNITSGLRIKTNDKKLDLVLSIDEQLKETSIISDPTRLSQLIYNLTSNAIKFTEKGSITIKLDCVQKTEQTIEVLFSVTDTGIGIHADRHDTIFELFTQAESHITRKYGGTGLGLAIVKQILLLFNSNIQLESYPGKGTKFFFTIPFTLAPAIPAVKGLKIPLLIEKHDLSQLRILIAEDNEINRLIIKKQLDKLHVNAVIVENGKLAYDACLSNQFDAIFMDLHMPVMDGYEATKHIRMLPDKGKAKVHIIAFTASVTEQEKISDTGFDDFLYKPVNMQDLSDKLQKIALLNPLQSI